MPAWAYLILQKTRPSYLILAYYNGLLYEPPDFCTFTKSACLRSLTRRMQIAFGYQDRPNYMLEVSSTRVRTYSYSRSIADAGLCSTSEYEPKVIYGALVSIVFALLSA